MWKRFWAPKEGYVLHLSIVLILIFITASVVPCYCGCSFTEKHCYKCFVLFSSLKNSHILSEKKCSRWVDLFFLRHTSACMCPVFDKPEQGLDLMVLLHQLIHAVCQQAECCAWCLISWNRAWVSQCCFIDSYIVDVTRQPSAVSMKWEHCAQCLTSQSRAWICWWRPSLLLTSRQVKTSTSLSMLLLMRCLILWVP